MFHDGDGGSEYHRPVVLLLRSSAYTRKLVPENAVGFLWLGIATRGDVWMVDRIDGLPY